jgi:hypothetical protein
MRLLALLPERRNCERDVCLCLCTDCPLLKQHGSAIFGVRDYMGSILSFVRCPSVVDLLLMSCPTDIVEEKHICIAPMLAPSYPCVTLFTVIVRNGAEGRMKIGRSVLPSSLELLT